MSSEASLADRIVALLPRLRRFALGLTRKPDDADDLVQAAVERALSNLDRWKEGSRLDSWLFRIMQNLWIDQMRSQRSRGLDVGDAELPEISGEDGRETSESRLTLQATMAAVFRLPEEQRVLMMLIVVEGYSYREAAETLDIPIGTVMSRLARARAGLERELQPKGPQERLH